MAYIDETFNKSFQVNFQGGMQYWKGYSEDLATLLTGQRAVSVCVCVCEREREREREYVSVCVSCPHASLCEESSSDIKCILKPDCLLKKSAYL